MAKPKPAGEDPQAEPSPASKELGKALWALFKQVRDAQIGGDKLHGWDIPDSMAMIEALVAEDASRSTAPTGKFTLSDECLRMIRMVVNPSSFRQKLEKKGILTAKESRRTGSLDTLEKEFGEENE